MKLLNEKIYMKYINKDIQIKISQIAFTLFLSMIWLIFAHGSTNNIKLITE